MSKWLVVTDVVQLLHVPEATIYRWIRQGDIPCFIRRGKYYFNQSTLISWADSKHIHLEEHKRRFRKSKEQVSQSRLIEALRAGNVFHAVPSISIESLFSASFSTNGFASTYWRLISRIAFAKGTSFFNRNW